jgi:Ca2+-binding RTX toxin-like protein
MCMGIEVLEERRLFAYAYQVIDYGDKLQINGTNSNDIITLQLAADHKLLVVAVDGHHSNFALGKISQVLIYAKRGNDKVNIDDSNGPIICLTYIYGGAGNDTLRGGSGADSIEGADGNDFLDAGNGPDVLNGGKGNDTLKGGAGDDQLYGADGKDYLYGGDGSDQLLVSNGRDVIYGGRGDDAFIAGGLPSDNRDMTAQDNQPTTQNTWYKWDFHTVIDFNPAT